jgi:hypothetical protein
MSTVPIRAPHLQFAKPMAGFERIISVVTTALEVFAQAQRGASAAQNRYPFAEW